MKFNREKLRKFQERSKQLHAALLDLGSRRNDAREGYQKTRSIVRGAELDSARRPKTLLSDMNLVQLREALRRDQAAKLELGKEKFGDANTSKGRELRSDLIPRSVNRSTVETLVDQAEELTRLNQEFDQAQERWRTAKALDTRLTEGAAEWDRSLRSGTPVGPAPGPSAGSLRQAMFGR